MKLQCSKCGRYKYIKSAKIGGVKIYYSKKIKKDCLCEYVEIKGGGSNA